jgi:hypothetical protein
MNTSDVGHVPKEALDEGQEFCLVKVFVSIDGREVISHRPRHQTDGLLADFVEANAKVERKPIEDQGQAAQAEDEPGGKRHTEETIIGGVEQSQKQGGERR